MDNRCLLLNDCEFRDRCCYFCKHIKCIMRCNDNVSGCRYFNGELPKNLSKPVDSNNRKTTPKSKCKCVRTVSTAKDNAIVESVSENKLKVESNGSKIKANVKLKNKKKEKKIVKDIDSASIINSNKNKVTKKELW